MVRSRSFTWCLSVALLILAGCGDGRPRRVPISGKVLIDGQPLTQGFIQIVPEADRAAFARIQGDGSFRLTTYDEQDGCVLGTHRVVIIAREILNASSQKWHAPKDYADTSTSTVTLEVSEPRDDVVINLTWDGGEPFIERFGGSDEEITEAGEGLE